MTKIIKSIIRRLFVGCDRKIVLLKIDRHLVRIEKLK